MQQIQFVVDTLAENYGFDAVAAFEYVIAVKREKSPAYLRAVNAIAKTQEKIDEQRAKISAGKVRNREKADEKLTKMLEKLDEQQTRLEDVGKPKERKPRAPKEPKPEAATKRLSKLSDEMTAKLKEIFAGLGGEMGNNEKKEFVKYVNELTDDDFFPKPLADHMRDYAAMCTKPPVNDTVLVLTHEQLRKRKNLTPGQKVGVFWDADAKEFVTGPVEDPDEDMTEVNFDGMDYVVGENTGRVYAVDSSGGGDAFVGYLEIAEFGDMSI
jgi:hypothetical protein